MYVCMHACVRACVRACMYACMHVCMYVCRPMHQSCQVVIRNECEILNVVTSRAPKVASRPAGGTGAWGCWKASSGVRGEAPEKKIVTKIKKNI